jgi:hypothetical protein
LLELACIATGTSARAMRSSPVSRLVVGVVVLSTLISLVALRSPAQAQSSLATDIVPASSFSGVTTAPNIQIDPLLQPLVEKLLQKSPTLRRQWQTIGAARILRVSLVVTALLRETGSARARTQVSRFAFGAIRAVVELPVVVDITELLPHELEHVIEQLEGVDLAALAKHGSAGVQQIGRGVYETTRARNAGFDALREVYGDVDPAVGAAARRVQRAFRALVPNGRVAADTAPPSGPAAPARAAGAPATAAAGHKQQ